MTQEHDAHPARHHRYITTYSSERIYSNDVQPEQIDKADMVRGLAMQVRYLGQIRNFYSIAEHSVLVSRLAHLDGAGLDVERAALLHDGHEYLTGDFPSPFKYDVTGLRDWECKIEASFRHAMGLPHNDHPIWEKVKTYDLIALHFEAKYLMRQDCDWIEDRFVSQVPRGVRIECLDWEEAFFRFSLKAESLGLEGYPVLLDPRSETR